MDHEPARIATIAIGLTAALVGGLLAKKVGLPTIGATLGVTPRLLPEAGFQLVVAGALEARLRGSWLDRSPAAPVAPREPVGR